MRVKKEKILASILKESPIYSELNGEERYILIKDLIKAYPNLFEGKNEDIEVGYEANWLEDQKFIP